MREIGSRLLIGEGDYVNCGGKYYKYVGEFRSTEDVPNMDCIYRIGMEIYLRQVSLREIESDGVVKQKKDDTSGKLNIKIHPSDNELMIIIKELLKDYSKNDFKNLFDNTTEANNMKRVIEETNELTWKRFTLILELLGLKHRLSIEN